MSKKVRVEMSVSYDVIRQMFCEVSGKVLTDEKLDVMFPEEVIYINTECLGVAQQGTEQMLASIVLADVLDAKPNRISKFEQRLEELKKQKGL
jgi:hypothetical protein